MYLPYTPTPEAPLIYPGTYKPESAEEIVFRGIREIVTARDKAVRELKEMTDAHRIAVNALRRECEDHQQTKRRLEPATNATPKVKGERQKVRDYVGAKDSEDTLQAVVRRVTEAHVEGHGSGVEQGKRDMYAEIRAVQQRHGGLPVRLH